MLEKGCEDFAWLKELKKVDEKLEHKEKEIMEV